MDRMEWMMGLGSMDMMAKLDRMNRTMKLDRMEWIMRLDRMDMMSKLDRMNRTVKLDRTEGNGLGPRMKG